MRLRERMGALDMPEVGGGMRPQRLAVGQQEVEGAVPGDARGQFAQRDGQLAHVGLPETCAEGARSVTTLHEASSMP